MADRDAHPRVEVLNEVVLNQVLVRVVPAHDEDAAATTREVVRRVQQDGTCWIGGSRWHDLDVIRISICNWSTTEDDIDRAADAILRAVEESRQAQSLP